MALLLFLARRTEWTSIASTDIVHRRRFGQVVRSAFTLERVNRAALSTIGLSYLPVVALTGAGIAVLHRVPVVQALLATESGIGTVSAAMSLLVGSVAHCGFVFVTAAVTDLLTAQARPDLRARCCVAPHARSGPRPRSGSRSGRPRRRPVGPHRRRDPVAVRRLVGVPSSRS
ncbi:MAG: hypothetical protein R2695_16150 [Acidimicrobiales bacterium]